MKDDNKGLFNAPDPIFTQGEDQFEGISAPLSSPTVITFALPSESNRILRGVTNTGSQIHMFWILEGSRYVIRRHNLNGTYIDSINITPPTSLSGSTFDSFTGGISFYNNKYYIVAFFGGPTKFALTRYSNTGSLESSSVYTFPTTNDIYDIDINNNILVYTLSGGFRSVTLSSGTETQCIGANVSSIRGAIALNSERIYVYTQDHRFVAYDSSYSRVSADDTPRGLSYGNFNHSTINGTSLFATHSSFSVFRYDGVPAPVSYTASWGSPVYRLFSRSIVATVTFTGDPTAFDADDFTVQEQNAQSNWVDASTGTWTITATGTGMSRVITATPNSSVDAGTYRINLPANAFATGQPSAAAATTGQAVAAYVAPSYTWSTAAITPAQDRSVSVSITFSVDPGTLDAEDDFEVQHRTSTGPDVWTTAPDANWALTVSGTGTTRTVRAAPVQMVAAGTYRLRLKADVLETDHPPDAVASPSFAIAAYTEPPGVATAAWSSELYCETSNRIEATLTFSGEKVEGLAAEDFEVITGTGGSTTGWTIVIPSTVLETTEIAAGTGTTIGATAPAGQNSSFRLRLKQLSVMSDDSTTDNAPADNVETNDIQVDNRGFMPTHQVATARWTNVSGGHTLSGNLTFSGLNMLGLATTDFEIYDDSDNEVTSSWTVTLPTGFNGNPVTGTPIRVTATPPANTNGSFYMRLPALSIDSGGGTANAPGINVDTDTLIVNNTVSGDGRSSYTLQIPIPRNLKGAIQISVPAEVFNVSGQLTQRGPRNTQYLGTVYVDYEIIPRIIRIDQQTEAVIGTNEVLFDFNDEVTGINADAFEIVGGPITVTNSDIFYAVTPDPDVRPDAMSRSTVVAANGSTSAKYYKISIELTALPASDFRIYLKDGAVNND